MSESKPDKNNLLHDFQTELHAVLAAVELVSENLHSDPEYCEEAIKHAAPKADLIREQWEQVRAKYFNKCETKKA